jgi:hypothetical protein
LKRAIAAFKDLRGDGRKAEQARAAREQAPTAGAR